MSDNTQKEFIGTYRGKKVLTVPDNKFTEIVLPQTLVNYILYLQNIEKEYREQQLKYLFNN